MKREDAFNDISSALETKLADENLNPYGAELVNEIPNSMPNNMNPQIVLTQIDYGLSRETLAKTEKKHTFSIEAQIFAIDSADTHRRVIANDIADLVETHIDGYGMTLESSNVIPNLQENVFRVILRFGGLIDDNTGIIYRE